MSVKLGLWQREECKVRQKWNEYYESDVSEWVSELKGAQKQKVTMRRSVT